MSVKSDLEPLSPTGTNTTQIPPTKAISSPIAGNREGDRVKNIIVPKEEIVRIKGLITATFPDAPIMVRVVEAESSFDCGVKNPDSSARGCFQILTGTWKDHACIGDVLDVEDNIACARKIYDDEGTRPWNSSKYMWGKYQK